MGRFHSVASEVGSAVKTGVVSGVKITIKLAKVILPVYIVMAFLKHTVLMSAASRALSPVMSVFGLPGEAAAAIVLGNAVSLYSALAAVKALQMSPEQVTIAGLMIVISHNLPSEYVVLQKMGAPAAAVTAARFVTSLVAGAVAGAVLR
jgi:hypothetical protein